MVCGNFVTELTFLIPLSTQDFLRQLDIQDNKSLQGTVTAIYDIGCFFGAIAAYFLGGNIGMLQN